MSQSISQFISKFQHGSRANLFRVEIPYLGEDCKFFCKASQIPGLTIEKIPVKYQNNNVYVHGDSDFPDWSVTIVNDKNYGIRKNLELWMTGIKSSGETSGSSNIKEYLKNFYVFQLDENGEDIQEYVFYHGWPTDLSPIDLSFDSPDTIQEYQVTFCYSFWERGGSLRNEVKDIFDSIKNDLKGILRF